MNPREAYIALNMIEDLGPITVRGLVERLGSPQAIFDASDAELRRAEGIGAERAAHILQQRMEADPAAEEARARKAGARIVTLADPDYPESLAACRDAPMVLYARGTFRPEDRQSLAIVGSRRCSLYGKSAADRLSFQLARLGFSIVSGLARGIDTAAHEGALKAGGRTIAVLGGALDCVYPPECQPLVDRIVENNGVVLSEYTMGRQPDRTTFPYRNRIISGLSLGVMVVECELKSGALHTARYAGEQGRPVFAVPGRIDSTLSQGPHRLIRDGAKLVEDVKDIVEEFEYLWQKVAAKQKELQAVDGRPVVQIKLSDEEQRVAAALLDGAMDTDRLVREAGLSASRLNVILVGLEMKRVIRLRPGRQVELASSPSSRPETGQWPSE